MTTRNTAHAARNRAAVDAWTFAQWAQKEAHLVQTARARTIAARALRSARLAANVCLLPEGEAVTFDVSPVALLRYALDEMGPVNGQMRVLSESERWAFVQGALDRLGQHLPEDGSEREMLATLEQVLLLCLKPTSRIAFVKHTLGAWLPHLSALVRKNS